MVARIQAGFDCVACTQPRRISTMSLCARVAAETLNEHGSQVSYVCVCVLGVGVGRACCSARASTPLIELNRIESNLI